MITNSSVAGTELKRPLPHDAACDALRRFISKALASGCYRTNAPGNQILGRWRRRRSAGPLSEVRPPQLAGIARLRPDDCRDEMHRSPLHWTRLDFTHLATGRMLDICRHEASALNPVANAVPHRDKEDRHTGERGCADDQRRLDRPPEEPPCKPQPATCEQHSPSRDVVIRFHAAPNHPSDVFARRVPRVLDLRGSVSIRDACRV